MTYTIETNQLTLLIILVIWEMFWKAMAMWRAAKRNQKYWFGALLLINTAGILPIAYLLLTRPKTQADDGPYLTTPVAKST